MVKYLHIVVLYFGCTLGLISCKDTPKQAVQTEPIGFIKEGELSLLQKETDSVLARLDIEIADSKYETETGLMYRQSMADHQGMLFVFSKEAMHSFYMKNTAFALDIIFLKNDLRIASIQDNAQPFDQTGLSSKVPVSYVLEVNAGLVSKWGLEVGDRMLYRRD